MELLLTGSTGFIGRNLLLRLVRSSRWSRLILPVRDPEKLRSQLAEEGISHDERIVICRVSGDFWELPSGINPELVIHAAGVLFGRRKEEYFRTNVEGSIRLVAQLPRTARVIVLSSLAAGGPTPKGEEKRGTHHRDLPVSFYGASKLTMEKELRNRLGSRLLILRPPMVLGPRDAATLPLFQMVKGVLRIKPGFATKHYSWIDIDDLCEAILMAASLSEWPQAGRFYLGAEETISDEVLLATAAASLGKKGVTFPVPQNMIRLLSLVIDAIPSWRRAVPSLGRDRVREILPNRWVSDGALFSKSFGWKARKALPQTLLETAEWLKLQGKI